MNPGRSIAVALGASVALAGGVWWALAWWPGPNAGGVGGSGSSNAYGRLRPSERYSVAVLPADVGERGEFFAIRDRLRNYLTRKNEAWTRANAEELVALMRQPITFEGESFNGVSVEVQTALYGLSSAFVMAGNRLLRGDPIEPEAAEILRRAILEGLRSPNWHVRSWALAAAFEGGLYETPEGRATIDRMARTDPNASIREFIPRRLEAYDRLRRLAAWGDGGGGGGGDSRGGGR